MHHDNSENSSDASPNYQDGSDSSSPEDEESFGDEDNIGLEADFRAEFVPEVGI